VSEPRRRRSSRRRAGKPPAPPARIDGNGNGNGEPPPPPQIDSISPTSGIPGTEVTLSGLGFGLRGRLSAVTFDPNDPDLGPVAAEIASWSTTSVRVRVPPLSSLGSPGGATVTLTNALGGAGTIGFTVRDTERPAIQSLEPTRALAGAELRILGVRFGVQGTGGTGVTFAGVGVPVVSWSRGEARVRVPDQAAVGGFGPKSVQVYTPWGTSDAAQFTIVEPPTVTAVTPAEAAPDTAITIAGRGFDAFAPGVSAVELRYVDPDLGEVVVTPLELDSWTPTEIRAFVPGLSALKESGVKQLFVRAVLGAGSPVSFSVIDVGSITSWACIEPHARSDDLDRGLGVGLRAEVADALWLLGRQWVVGELQGEDAGSPVAARVDGEAAPFTRWRPGSGGAAADLPTGVPLETLVERERIFPARDAPAPFTDRRLAAEAGLHYLRILTTRVAATQAQTYRRRYLELYGLATPTDDERETLDAASLHFLAVVARRAPDGARLHADLRQALPQARGGSGRLPPDPEIRDQDREAVLAAIADWFTWTETLASEPAAGQTAWERERLEYAFAVAAETSAGEVVLEAPEYFEGRLDWYALRRGAGSLRGDQPPAGVVPIASTMVPTSVAYPGMPSPRWWEIEAARVDFGAVDAGPPDLMRLLLVEFATVFGNDWFMVPLGGVPSGSVVRIGTLGVTDAFGEVTTVTPFTETGPGGAWRLFQPSGDPADRRDLLMLPATVAGALESAALEEVVFVRDELANMAWAVERTVASETGRPSNRQEAYEEARRRAEAQQTGDRLPPAEPPLVYRLMSTVPDFWIPFVPRPDSAARRLARGAFRRPRPDGTLAPIPPLGRILEPETVALQLFDIEVPPEGARVTRTFQLARDAGGGTHLWLGRQKQTTASERSSGLRFDVVEDVRGPGA
jgi:hypothetical protein